MKVWIKASWSCSKYLKNVILKLFFVYFLVCLNMWPSWTFSEKTLGTAIEDGVFLENVWFTVLWKKKCELQWLPVPKKQTNGFRLFIEILIDYDVNTTSDEFKILIITLTLPDFRDDRSSQRTERTMRYRRKLLTDKHINWQKRLAQITSFLNMCIKWRN